MSTLNQLVNRLLASKRFVQEEQDRGTARKVQRRRLRRKQDAAKLRAWLEQNHPELLKESTNENPNSNT